MSMADLFHPHPVVPVPSGAQIAALVAANGAEAAAEELRRIESKRREVISLMEHDAYQHGYVPPHWRKAQEIIEGAGTAMLALFGGNGSAKTFFMVWHAMRKLVDNAGFRVLVLHESENSSIDTHQRFFYHYLPVAWKPTDTHKVRKGITAKVRYTEADGFTGNKFVLPNGSLCQFGFYGQNIKDYEGGGWNLILLDEDAPFEWIETLQFRLPRKGGKMIWSFTPIKGITLAIRNLVQGARTVESRRAVLLPETHRAYETQDWPEGHMPVLQTAPQAATKILYFFTEENPFSGYEAQKALCYKLSLMEIERRFYGFARNTLRCLFPKFGAVNIVPHDEMMAKVRGSGVTRYHVMDPAGARNMFMLWCAVDADGRHFVYREWPDVETHGEWAVEDKEGTRRKDGAPGPAQASLGYGVVEYKRLILEAEGNTWDAERGWIFSGEEIFERLIDSRAGKAESMSEKEGSSSIIDRFAQEQEIDGVVAGPAMDFIQASGQREDDGLAAIQNLLSYNPQEPVTNLVNEPRLFVSDRCENLIWAMQNYTKSDGEKAACKDPIDCLRYLATEGLEHAGPGWMDSVKHGAFSE